ncbi:Mov34/MPN/PAD-1 family protein [Heterostelium album PN500]|uniref:Eukaryotic translation initiation factor 3 subunit H n=1 Tax=Heterostelium pallidum (strain ATCC 26659 / Pp 5 / PN500) TaxID=670386 RepID=D3BJY8_HETP5|nr:Mov34/MPN/PAD-1 family protein [Heterostelium album PN500]EFA78218.1 Mov34/MPN/PAD-1 family protein [Heterostelium album PN500]|eukprot:XP_020430344.1 Mov34/MPN/PAD-1 family protein [Heterostelium album PN500]
MNIDQQIEADFNNPKLDVVQIDGIVVMKIIKNCKEYLPELVPGQLLGIDIGTSLEVSSCFPFPNLRDQEDDLNEGGIAEYQLEMMRFLREVNIDSNTVGWYTPTYLNSFFNESVIETQYKYQSAINQKCVLLVYDPIKTAQGTLSLRCYRLTTTFMELFRNHPYSRERMDNAALSFADIFEQIPIRIHNAQLINALLYELRDDSISNFDRLNIGNNLYLEKVVEGMTDCVDSLSQEVSKVANYQRQYQQQQFIRNSFIQKKTLEGQKVEEEEIAAHVASMVNKPLHAPSKVTSLLLTNQINNYCDQLSSFCGGSLTKLSLYRELTNK